MFDCVGYHDKGHIALRLVSLRAMLALPGRRAKQTMQVQMIVPSRRSADSQYRRASVRLSTVFILFTCTLAAGILLWPSFSALSSF